MNRLITHIGGISRRRARSLTALALAGACALATGCGGDPATTETASIASTAATGALAMPADWPSAVPVIGGELVVSTFAGDEASRTWVVEFLTPPPADAWPVVQSQLEDAGFSAESAEITEEGWHLGVFSDGAYSVRIKAYREADTGEDEVAYTVSRLASP